MDNAIKICTYCLIEKPLDQFYKNKNHSDGYTNYCKVCTNMKHKEWIAKNPKFYFEINTQLRIDRLAAGLCMRCDQHRLPFSNIFCEDHFFMNKSASRLKSSEFWQDIKEKFYNQNMICPYSGKKLTLGIDASIDHILPVSRFPLLINDLNNIEWVDWGINCNKRNMTKEEYLQSERYKLKLFKMNEQRPSKESNLDLSAYGTPTCIMSRE